MITLKYNTSTHLMQFCAIGLTSMTIRNPWKPFKDVCVTIYFGEVTILFQIEWYLLLNFSMFSSDDRPIFSVINFLLVNMCIICPQLIHSVNHNNIMSYIINGFNKIHRYNIVIM